MRRLLSGRCVGSCLDAGEGHRHNGRVVVANHDLRIQHVEDLQQLLDADRAGIRFDVGDARLHDPQQLCEPGLGQAARLAQRAEVLLELGLGPEEVERLVEAGIIRTLTPK